MAEDETIGRVNLEGARQVMRRASRVSSAARTLGTQQKVPRPRIVQAAKAIRIGESCGVFAAFETYRGPKRQRFAMAVRLEKQGFAVHVASGRALAHSPEKWQFPARVQGRPLLGQPGA
jgi:hypothetical protein